MNESRSAGILAAGPPASSRQVNQRRLSRLLVIALVLVGCRGEQSTNGNASDATNARPTIAVEYISAPELKIHAKPDEASPVISTYENGESVSVLARKEGWVEVRTGTGSGWARAADLRTAEAATQEPDSLTPRFRKSPAPITQTTTHGEIVLEADVNTDGDVTAVRTESNTTGSTELEVKNTAELRSAKFFPIVQHGKRVPFTYEYRVHY
jgi:uncharacterized protein YgiM (DUF1202 family)